MSDIVSLERTLPRGAFALPAGWQLLPSRDTDPSEWVEAYLDGLPVQPTALTRAQLRYGLMTVIEVTLRMDGGTRYNFALIGEPLDGVVRALLTLQKHHVTKDAYDNLLYHASNPRAADGVETINRTVEQFSLPAGRAIVMHDFVMTTDFESVPEPATERTTLSLFLTAENTMLDFALYAQDLAAFEDMPAYLIDIVAPLDFSGAAS